MSELKLTRYADREVIEAVHTYAKQAYDNSEGHVDLDPEEVLCICEEALRGLDRALRRKEGGVLQDAYAKVMADKAKTQTGKCPHGCGGDGWYNDWTGPKFQRRTCPIHGQTGECPQCGGTGNVVWPQWDGEGNAIPTMNCPACKGTGRKKP